MPDHRWLLDELRDDGQIVVGDVLHRLAGEHVGVGVGLLAGARVVRPSWGQGDVAVVFEQLSPPIPAAGQQPQPVHKHHRRQPGVVGAFHLRPLPIGHTIGLLLVLRCSHNLAFRS